MNQRQARLLQAIIDQFISTALPVGSKQLVECGSFRVSGATIRNEMQILSEAGFIAQPHVSAGRIPTAKGYRAYVQQYLDPSRHQKDVQKRFSDLKQVYFQRKDQERVFEAVSLLAHMIPDVAFATVPHKHRVYYVGLANVLRQPEFQSNPQLASGVAEVLEEQLNNFLENVEVDDQIRYYIGEEHLLNQIQSCSIILTEYQVRDKKGVGGILGPMRMDYGYNTAALEMVADLVRGG